MEFGGKKTNFGCSCPRYYAYRTAAAKMVFVGCFGWGRAEHGVSQKSKPWEQFYISAIIAEFFRKFTAFTDEDSGPACTLLVQERMTQAQETCTNRLVQVSCTGFLGAVAPVRGDVFKTLGDFLFLWAPRPD